MKQNLLAVVCCCILLALPQLTRADLIGTPQLPPFAKSGVAPNVLLILDHSNAMGSRWEQAKATLRAILQTYAAQGIRFGLMRMNSSNHEDTETATGGRPVFPQGGRLLLPCGTPAAEIIASLDNWPRGHSGSPGETLMDAGRYLATGRNAGGERISTDETRPNRLACQRNVIILITAGNAGNHNAHPGCPAGGCTALDDAATQQFEKQNIVTHVIGFRQKHPLLQKTASRGHGLYLNADDQENLLAQLGNVLGDFRTEVVAGTPLVIADEANRERFALRTRFRPRDQTGDLQAFPLPLPDPLPEDFLAAPLWSAADRLAAADPDRRQIFTAVAVNGNLRKRAFDESVRAQLAPRWDLPAAEASALLPRIRAQPLGTIIHSTPVVIGPPKFHYTDNGYPAFRKRWQNRPTLIYAGANDGMLHAFHASGNSAAPIPHAAGEEAWAYIPAHLHPQLKSVAAAEHRYRVDLHPVANDVWDRSWDIHDDDASTADGDGWKTMLIGSGRLGTQSYFALDVTDPSAHGFELLWEKIPHPGARASTRPLLVRLETAGGGASSAVFTSGYREDGAPAGICALRVSDGTELVIWQSGSTGLRGRLELPGGSGSSYHTLSDPVGFDADDNGNIDVIYAGDSHGILWKFFFDFVSGAWKATARFATGGQPITARPTLVPDREGYLRIYFGTGRLLVDLDRADSQPNAFYSLVEKRRKTPRGEMADANENSFATALPFPTGPGDLIEVTAHESEQALELLAPEKKRALKQTGWFFALEDPAGSAAERVVSSPQVLAGGVFFTSLTPNANPCSFGARSRLYAVNWENGLQAGIARTETVLKQKGGSDLPAGQRFAALGSDGLAGLCWDDRSAPGAAHSEMLLQNSDGSIDGRKILLPGQRLSIQGWREINH